MITQNLTTNQKEELLSFYSEKVAQLQFQVLKMRRALTKRQAQEQKWLEDMALYQKRKTEGEVALQVLSESNPYYHKIRLDVQKCEIRIMRLEIRLQRFTLVQKAEKITKIMALEASISYYQQLISDLENIIPIQNTRNIRLDKEQQDVEVNSTITPVIDPFKVYTSSQRERMDLKRA
jgi:hypothetical protein